MLVLSGCNGNNDNDGTPAQTPVPVASSDASLASLTLSDGTLVPAFDPGVTGYAATVDNVVDSITATASPADAGASADVAGTGTSNATVALIEGDNTITVVVTAEDGTTTQTYTVAITRTSAAALAQTAYLKSSSSPGDIFGRHLAVDGNTVAVGVEWEDRDVSGVNITNPDPDDWFGARLGLDGDLLVSGALNESSAATGVNGDQTDNTSPGSGAVYVLE